MKTRRMVRALYDKLGVEFADTLDRALLTNTGIIANMDGILRAIVDHLGCEVEEIPASQRSARLVLKKKSKK